MNFALHLCHSLLTQTLGYILNQNQFCPHQPGKDVDFAIMLVQLL